MVQHYAKQVARIEDNTTVTACGLRVSYRRRSGWSDSAGTERIVTAHALATTCAACMKRQDWKDAHRLEVESRAAERKERERQQEEQREIAERMHIHRTRALLEIYQTYVCSLDGGSYRDEARALLREQEAEWDRLRAAGKVE